MKNQLICLGAFVVLGAASINAADLSKEAATNQASSSNPRVEALNLQIQDLQKRLHELHLKLMKANVDSESYMKYEWSSYTEEIEKAERDQQEIDLLQHQLDQLTRQRDALLQGKSS